MTTISIAPAQPVEESSRRNLEFTVTLSEASLDAVTVNYRLRLAGTATDRDLFYAPTSSSNNGTLTFAPGETTQSIYILANSDSLDERDEHVVVELYDARGATLANNLPVLRATGVIHDDDGAGSNLALLVSDPVLREGDDGAQEAVFEVRLSRPAPSAFTVSYTTVDGSARAGSDYTGTSGTLSFAEGQESRRWRSRSMAIP